MAALQQQPEGFQRIAALCCRFRKLIFPGRLKCIRPIVLYRFVNFKTGEDNKQEDEQCKDEEAHLSLASGYGAFLRGLRQVIDVDEITAAVFADFGDEISLHVLRYTSGQVGKEDPVMRSVATITDPFCFGYLCGCFCALAKNVVIVPSLHQENSHRQGANGDEKDVEEDHVTGNCFTP